MFACPKCGNYIHGVRAKQNRDCPVCHMPSNQRRSLTDPRINVEYVFYAHDACFWLIKSEYDLDKKQFDAEMERFKVIMTMTCPECHIAGDIILQDDRWVCTNCGVILDNDWVNHILADKIIEPLKCLRCGETYTLQDGHNCELRTNYNLD